MSRVRDSDVLFGFRQKLFVLAAQTTVAFACRAMGVYRSPYYRWKRRVERHGIGILRPRERRAPRMPNQFSQQTERRIVAFALAHPGAGPDRIASELRREKWGELVVSASRVYRVLRRHGRLEARAIGFWGSAPARQERVDHGLHPCGDEKYAPSIRRGANRPVAFTEQRTRGHEGGGTRTGWDPRGRDRGRRILGPLALDPRDGEAERVQTRCGLVLVQRKDLA